MTPHAHGWSARDWRQFVALTLLAAGDVPLTVVFAYSIYVASNNARNGSALMLGLEAGAIVLFNRLGIAAVLGRRTFKFKVGDAVIDATGGGAERVLNQAEE